MKKLSLILSLSFIYGISYSQDIIIDNSTDCYYHFDVGDVAAACNGDINGPMDSPPGTVQTYDMMSMVGFTGPSDIGNIYVTKSDDGSYHDVDFGCGSASSPALVSGGTTQCLSTNVYVSWSVCGSDFCIDIYF